MKNVLEIWIDNFTSGVDYQIYVDKTDHGYYNYIIYICDGLDNKTIEGTFYSPNLVKTIDILKTVLTSAGLEELI